jgi:hypothetical protein
LPTGDLRAQPNKHRKRGDREACGKNSGWDGGMLAVKLHRVRRLAHFKSMHWQEGGSNWGGDGWKQSPLRSSATRDTGGHQEVPLNPRKTVPQGLLQRVRENFPLLASSPGLASWATLSRPFGTEFGLPATLC